MYRVAAYQVGVLTLAPSGSATINPLLSDQAFASICISCTPLGSGPDYRHKVELYVDGVLKEENDYTASGVKESTHMIYNDRIFPPNVNVKNRPDMNGFEPPTGNDIAVTITNYESEQRDFDICTTFEMFSTTCRRINFNS